jgi:hypothetical protein
MNTELVIANFALVAVTIGLVIVTWLYVGHTKRLADDTKRMADMIGREFELKMSFVELEITYAYHCEIGLSIFNEGIFPVEIQKVIFRWWPRNKPDVINEIERVCGKTVSNKTKIDYPIRLFEQDFIKEEFPDGKGKSLKEIVGLIDGEVYATFINYEGEHKVTKPCKTPRLIGG